MNLLLRSCVFNQRKLFIQKVVPFTRIFLYSTNDSIKKFAPSLQARHLSMKSNDNVDEELIYTGSLMLKVRNLKLVSLLTSTLGTLAQPIIFMKVVADDNLMGVGTFFALLNLFSIGTPILIHLLSKRYVITMYKCHNGKYIANVYSFFCSKKQITFTLKDVTGHNSGTFTTCIAKNYPLLFDRNDFIDPNDYFTIMRCNMPLEFAIRNSNVTSSSKPSIIKKTNEEK